MYDVETLLLVIAAAVVLGIFLGSVYSIGPTEVGLVRKRFGTKLPGDDPLAFRGEAGYQADMLMPGLRFKLYLVYAVTKHPWVQVPAGKYRGGHRPGWTAPADRRQVGGVQTRVR